MADTKINPQKAAPAPPTITAPTKTTTTTPPPNPPSSKIALREITETNWRAVANLRLPPHQAGNLAPNPMSMCEGHYSEDAWMRAVYISSEGNNNTTITNTNNINNPNTDNPNTTSDSNPSSPIGFLMLALWPPTQGYYIWRLMIDHHHQGHGYGRDVVRAAIEHVRSTYPEAETLGAMSTPKEGCAGKKVRAEDSPFGFWEGLGFRQVAEPDEDGEVMMEMGLRG